MVDFVNFSDFAPADVNADCTAAFKACELYCRTHQIRKVALLNRVYLVSTAAAGGPTVILSSYVRQWLGDMDDTIIRLKGGALIGDVTMWQQSNTDNALLSFKLDGQAAVQMAGLDDHDAHGNLVGFRSNGLRLDSCNHPEVHVSVWNQRSISATGDGSTFGMRSGKGIGGDWWLDFRTTDDSIGSECAVWQGKSLEAGAQANPWHVHSLVARNMWRGMGCFGGGWGIVDGLDCQDLTGPNDAEAPGGKISGNACNIESGRVGTTDGVGGTKSVIINSPRTKNCDRLLVCTNNYGTETNSIIVNDAISTQDDNCIVFGGNRVAGLVQFNNCFFDRPNGKIITGNASQRTNLKFVGSTYNAADSKVGVTPIPSGLTSGSAPANTAPQLSAITPANGSAVTGGSTVIVGATIADNGPISDCTAAGQAYLPAVNTSSITVSGTTATCATAAAHGATNGAAVRIAGVTPSAHNGKKTGIVVVDATHFTYTVPGGTANATVQGTVEPVGAAITMTITGNRAEGPWVAPAATAARTIDITVNDNDATDPKSTTATTTITAVPLTITNGSPLADAVIGQAYAVALTATGGSGATPTWTAAGLTGHGLTYSIVSGELRIASTSIIGSDGDSVTFTATVTKDGYSVPKQFTINIVPPESTGDTYGPVVTAISLPDGSIVTELTEISAKAVDDSGVNTMTAVLTTEGGTRIELPMVPKATPPPADAGPTITTTTLANAQVGVAYADVTFTATDSDSDALPLTWSMDASSDALPTGVTFNSGVFHVGTPGSGIVGTYDFVFKVLAHNGLSDAVAIQFTIDPATAGTMTFVPPALPAAQVGAHWKFSFGNYVGNPQGTVTFDDGPTPTLPPWITLNTATGDATILPGATGATTASFAIRAKDGTSTIPALCTITVDTRGGTVIDIASIPGVYLDLDYTNTSAANRAKAVSNTTKIVAAANSLPGQKDYLWCSGPMGQKLVLSVAQGGASNGNGKYYKATLGQLLFGNLKPHVMYDEPIGTLPEAPAGTISTGPNQKHFLDINSGTRPIRIEFADLVDMHNTHQKQIDPARTTGTVFGLEIGAAKLTSSALITIGRLDNIVRISGISTPVGQPFGGRNGRAVTGGPATVAGFAAKDIFDVDIAFTSGGSFGWARNENTDGAPPSTWTNGNAIQRSLPDSNGVFRWHQLVGQGNRVHHHNGGGLIGRVQWLPGSGGGYGQHSIKTEGPTPTGPSTNSRSIALVVGYSSICPALPWGPQLTPQIGDIVTHDMDGCAVLVDGKNTGIGHVEINGLLDTSSGGSGVSPVQFQGAAPWVGTAPAHTETADGKIKINGAHIHTPTAGVGPCNVQGSAAAAIAAAMDLVDAKYGGATGPRGNTSYHSGTWVSASEPF